MEPPQGPVRPKPTGPPLAPPDTVRPDPALELLASPDEAPTEVPSSRGTTGSTNRVDSESTHSDLVAQVAITCAAQQSPEAWLAEHGYQVERLLGRGGQGEVFLARQQALSRDVAIKVPRSDIVLTVDFQRRFLDEAKIVSQLEHPNVIAVFDMITESYPAIIYEYCTGGTLADLLQRGQTLEETAAVKLFALIADALGFAHERGVLHRDLKPSNIMLVPSDRGSDQQHTFCHQGAWYVPKLADFGLARLDRGGGGELTDAATGMVPGTPDYMSPEQSIGRGSDAGTFSDTFSLGVVMYRAVVGKLPFKADSRISSILQIENSDFELPRRRRPELSTDLEAVILKSLKANPAERYRDGHQLAEDLQRLQAGLPVDALPYTWRNRVQYFVRRYPAAALSGLIVLLCLLSVVAVLWRHHVLKDESLRNLAAINRKLEAAIERSERSEAAEIAQRKRAEDLLYVSEVRLADIAFQAGDMANYQQILENHIPAAEQADHRTFSWHWLWEQGHPAPLEIDRYPAAAHSVELSDDGRWLLTASADGHFRIYETDQWQLVASQASDQGEINAACFSPDLQYVATSGDDGTVKVWDRQTQQLLQTLAPYQNSQAFAVRFTSDSQQIVVCSHKPVISVWNWRTAERVAELTDHTGAVHELRISADGRQMLSAGRYGECFLWDTTTWKRIRSLPSLRQQRIADAIFFTTQDGSWVVQATLPSSTNAHATLLLQSTSSKERHILQTVAIGFQSISAIEELGILVVGYRDGGLSVLDISDFLARPIRPNPQAKVLRRWNGHDSRVYSLDLTPDKKYFVSCSRDGQVCRWPTGSNQQVEFLDLQDVAGIDPSDMVHSLTYAAEKPRVVLLTHDEELILWDPLGDQPARIVNDIRGQAPPEEVSAIVVDPAGKVLYLGNTSGDVARLDLQGSRATTVWKASRAVNHPEGVPAASQLVLSPDGKILAHAISRTPEVLALYATDSGRLLGEHRPPNWTSSNANGPAFSPQTDSQQGGRIAYAAGGQLVALQWDHQPADGSPLPLQPLATARLPSKDATNLAFYDHDTVIVAADNNQLWRWSLNHLEQPLQLFKGQCGTLVTYCPSTKEIWTSLAEHAVSTWCPFTSQHILNIAIPASGSAGSIQYIGKAVVGNTSISRVFWHPLDVTLGTQPPATPPITANKAD